MPFDRSRYPDDWEQVVAEVNRRAGNACEWCKAPNGAVGWRNADGSFECAPDYLAVKQAGYGFYVTTGRLKIVLTTAHLDADGDICRCEGEDRKKCSVPGHLRALCQSCHLRYDHPRHVRNAAETRRRKELKRQPVLFDLPTPARPAPPAAVAPHADALTGRTRL